MLLSSDNYSNLQQNVLFIHRKIIIMNLWKSSHLSLHGGETESANLKTYILLLIGIYHLNNFSFLFLSWYYHQK